MIFLAMKASRKTNTSLHIQQDPISREQIEKMFNKRRHKKLTKKIDGSSSMDETNFEKVSTTRTYGTRKVVNFQCLKQIAWSTFLTAGQMMNQNTLRYLANFIY